MMETMPGTDRRRAALALGVAIALASCTHQPPPAAIAEAPVSAPPRPLLAGNLGAIVPPPRGEDGSYQTINRGIDARQAMWHVRAALNVAAIGCRAPEDAALVANYNSVLKAQKTALADANTSVEASFHTRFGTGWQTAHDQYMTRLYNFFAQPAAKPAFCAAADALAAQATITPAAGFATFAADAMPQLEAPFLAVYREIDATHAAQLAWDARYGSGGDRTTLAAAVTPVTPAATVRLAYADMATLIAWQAPRGTAIASR